MGAWRPPLSEVSYDEPPCMRSTRCPSRAAPTSISARPTASGSSVSAFRCVTVAELTPYSIETAHGEGQYFPGRGFAYVVADVRGRGDSEGQFLPWLCDAQDGDDLIEWITQQPWSDGRVVLYGGSDSNGHLEKVGRCAYRCGSIASRGRVVSRDRDR